MKSFFKSFFLIVANLCFLLSIFSCNLNADSSQNTNSSQTSSFSAIVYSKSYTSITISIKKTNDMVSLKLYVAENENPSSNEDNLIATTEESLYEITGLSDCTKYYIDILGFDSNGEFLEKISLSCKTNKYIDDSNLENLSAQELTILMGNGINLGNTFDAVGRYWLGYDNTVDAYASAWGMPKTTEAMFIKMKASGLDSVRIPVSWTNTMDFNNGDFEISADFLAGVKEAVDWALNAGLYVILNDHHDGEWQKLFSSNETLAWKIFDSIWEQVGEYFKDEPLQLIFEGGNEQFGNCLGFSTKDENYAMTNKINQHFVDFIRAQGGNNTKRFLLLPGYDTGFTDTADSRWKMPTDSANTVIKLMASVHYYDPGFFAIYKMSNKWGSKDQYQAAMDLFATMKTMIDQGYGVVVGEYAPSKDYQGNKKEGAEDWIKTCLDLSDYYNYVPLLWDCSDYFNRNTSGGKALGFGDYPEIAEIYSSRSYAIQGNVTGTGLDTVKARMTAAPECIYDTSYSLSQTSKAIAYIGYSEGGWQVNTAQIGDKWNPDVQMCGVVCNNVEFTSATTGTYTVSLDFSNSILAGGETDFKAGEGKANGGYHLYLQITNGNKILSGKKITVTEIKAGSTSIPMSGTLSTTASGSGNVSLEVYSEWGSNKLIDMSKISNASSLSITFKIE